MAWTQQPMDPAAYMHRLPAWHVPPRRQQSPHLLHDWVSLLPTGVTALPGSSGGSSSVAASSSRFRLCESCTAAVLRLHPGHWLWLRHGDSTNAADGLLLSLLSLIRLLVEAGRLDGCGNGQRGLGANRQVFCHLQDLSFCPSLQPLPPPCISNDQRVMTPKYSCAYRYSPIARADGTARIKISPVQLYHNSPLLKLQTRWGESATTSDHLD